MDWTQQNCSFMIPDTFQYCVTLVTRNCHTHWFRITEITGAFVHCCTVDIQLNKNYSENFKMEVLLQMPLHDNPERKEFYVFMLMCDAVYYSE